MPESVKAELTQGPLSDVVAKPDRTLRRQFLSLRREVHAQQDKDLALRRGTQLSDFEMRIARLEESFEPQVRGVLRVMNEKGYRTHGSGFSQFDPQEQLIFGSFVLDNATKAKLREMGIEAREENGPLPTSRISFFPARPDIEEMTAVWDSVGEVLPRIGPPVVFPGSEAFQRFWSEELQEFSEEQRTL